MYKPTYLLLIFFLGCSHPAKQVTCPLSLPVQATPIPLPSIQFPKFEPWQPLQYRRPILKLDTCPITQQFNWKVEIRPQKPSQSCDDRLDIRSSRKLEYLELCELALAVKEHPNFVGDEINLVITGDLRSEMSADHSYLDRWDSTKSKSGRLLTIDIYGQLEQWTDSRTLHYRLVDFQPGYAPVIGIALCLTVVT